MKKNITVHMAGDLKLALKWRKRDWMPSNEFCISVIEQTQPNYDEEGRGGSGARGTQLGCHPHPWGTSEKSLPWNFRQMSKVRLKINYDKGVAC